MTPEQEKRVVWADRERIRGLGQMVYDYVFALIDAELDTDIETVSDAAHGAEQAVVEAMTKCWEVTA